MYRGLQKEMQSPIDFLILYTYNLKIGHAVAALCAEVEKIKRQNDI